MTVVGDNARHLNGAAVVVTGVGGREQAGEAVARAFAKTGAIVHCVGRRDEVRDRATELRVDGMTAHAHVVDLRIDASHVTARDGDFEFARQVREVAIADKEIVHRMNERRGVVKLTGVCPRHRAVDNIAHAIAARFGC